MEIKNEPVIKLDCKQGLIKAVRFNADGQYALTCGSDRTVKLWRPSKLLQLKCYKAHSAEVTDSQANNDSSQFVSCSNDKSIIVWDVETGKILRRLRNMAPFNSVCYGGQDFTTALAGSVDGTVRIYDLRISNAWEPIQSLTEADDSVTCCRVHKHLIFSTSLDKSLRTYDIRKGSLQVDTFHQSLNHVSIGQNGDLVLVACVRGNSLLLDRANCKILNEYQGHENKLFKLESTFAMDDSTIVSGSEDGRVYLWDLNSGQPRGALEHLKIMPPIIQSISSDSMDYLLSACGSHLVIIGGADGQLYCSLNFARQTNDLFHLLLAQW